MFNFLKKKSHYHFNILDLLRGNDDYSYSNNKMLEAYIKACPIFTATKWIVDACNDIQFVLKDKNKDELVYKHPILNLLNKPNPFVSNDEFKKQVFSSLLLTGNIYITKTLSQKGEPLELYYNNPKDVSIFASSQDHYAGQYSISNLFGATFNRTGDYRFISSNGNEIIHHKEYNPDFSSSNLFGISFFAGCSLEVEQYIESSLHNLSLIKNGGRPSGLITFKGNKNLSGDSAKAIKESIDDKLKGGANAGKIIFLSDDFSYQTLGESIKDMDYKSLHENAEQKIFKAVKIPTAMINNQAMTYSNLDVSRYAFYDSAVIPVFNTVCKFFASKILNSYKDGANYELTFDKSAISALENREITNARDAFKDGLISRNESRAKIGYESVAGGDNIYQPSALVAVGIDSHISDNRESPAKKELRRLMLKNGYSKEDIESTVKSYES
jgi:HK97 family phage portal protein